MQIYLIRHAHALDGDDDAARPLSAKGRRQIRTMASHLRRAGLLQTNELWHSPLVRARDTARLLAEGLRVQAKLVKTDGLEPCADLTPVAQRLARLRRPIAIIGHEPHLSALATRLLGARDGEPVVVMKVRRARARARGKTLDGALAALARGTQASMKAELGSVISPIGIARGRRNELAATAMLDDLIETLLDDVDLGLKGSRRAQVIMRIFFGGLGLLLSGLGGWHMLFRVEGGLHLRFGTALMFALLAGFCLFNVCLLKKWRWPGRLFLASFALLFVLRIVFGP
jgi:phosphohistidine phosphatase